MANAARTASQLLVKHGVRTTPVDVEAIARAEEITIAFRPFDGNVSAVLYREEGRASMGVNSRHARTRQRFSIAHELGHFLLHKGQMFLDKVRVNFRDERASMGTWRQEIEANEFAAEVLMPADLVSTAVLRWRSNEGDLDRDDVISALASQFEVSPEAMGYRLTNLGFRPQV